MKSDSEQKTNKIHQKANRLIDETSTYLLQHAYNPVEWYPWGQEALSKALKEDKPILLSVGYSACHWCHVMEKESFEDLETAKLMNELFINIKVDREERTDIDEIYMKAVQLLSGHGGWPMTVFLTPKLQPFYAGTYFPPKDRPGLPSFKRILQGIDSAWKNNRQEIEESSNDISKHLSLFDQIDLPKKSLDQNLLIESIIKLSSLFDSIYGGFGGAPKFPHTSSIELIIRQLRNLRKSKNSSTLNLEELENIISTTLDHMANGGIQDQIGGGFARYSVDRKWLIPHFEKMLYDNALIASNYFDASIIAQNEYWLYIACRTLDFVLDELALESGGFYCSLDADSEGEEGKFYVWQKAEIETLFTTDKANWICRIYDISEKGNFENNNSVLNLSQSPKEIQTELNLTFPEFIEHINEFNKILLNSRHKRVRPMRDDKMLTSWSSLMLSSLVKGYKISGNTKYLEQAKLSANFILSNLYHDARLLRTYGKGKAKLNAYLDDYAYLIQSLLDLASIDANLNWFKHALLLNESVLKHFFDTDSNEFYYTSDDHEQLLHRSKHFYDSSVPSASSVTASNLLRLSRICNNQDWYKQAELLVSKYSNYFTKAPDQFSNMLCVLDSLLSNSLEIAIIYNSRIEELDTSLLSPIYTAYLPEAVIILADESDPNFHEYQSICPLLNNKQTIEHKTTIYICQNYSCLAPTTEPKELKKLLTNL